MPTERLLVDLLDGVLTLTLNRPEKRNALSMAMLDDLGEALETHADDPAVRCAVITGAGDKCFAAGGDLKELDAVRTAEQTQAMAERGRAALDRVRYFPVPVIAALNGLALGGGAELAIACDLRIAAPKAELGFIQSQLNVTTAWGGGIDLVYRVGGGKALELLASGQRVPAYRSLQLGIVDAVCPENQEFETFVREYLQPYAERSPQVLRGYKAVATEHRRRLHAELDLVAQEQFIATWTHEDHWAAAEAALKK